MARDYAGHDRRTSARKPTGLPGWIWLVSGLTIGLFIAVVGYITRPAQPIPSAKVNAPPAGQVKKPRVEIPPKEDPRFDFYTLLEEEQVVVSGDSAPSPSRPVPPKPAPQKEEKAPVAAATAPEPSQSIQAAKPASKSERYLILAGSFRDAENAEKHKANLALSGIEARIETVTGQQNETWHRVRIGPRDSLESAQAALAQLKINGYDGRVIRQP